MKKIGIISMALMMLGISMLSTGCMGSWKLTSSLYGWNEKISGNKYINNILFWVLSWAQIYTITIVIDYVILNTVQFWTGSNPLAMHSGDKEQQIVKGKDGKNYEITATQNRFDIVCLNDKKNKTALIYTPVNHSWNIEKNGNITKIATIHEDLNKVEIFHSDGSVSLHDMNMARVGPLLQTGLSN